MPNISTMRKPKPDAVVADTIVEYKTCELSGCSRRFDPDRPNQRYCSPVHQDRATRIRRAERRKDGK